MEPGTLILAIVFAILIGGIPSGLLAARYLSDVDLRSVGSGNIGATNIYRAFGLKWAVAVFLADALKGLLPVIMARGLLLPPAGVMAAGFVAVLAHVYNPYLRFKGGKGVATAFGVMLAIVPWAALLALAVWAAIALTTRRVSLGSLVAAAVLPFATLFLAHSWAYRIGAFLVTGLVIYSHRENIARLKAGEEKPVQREPSEK
ncbi:MAG TPA: glycerol-3-phosphate 1-O-acyltransferase PlsY [bacterium]|nr:glycerol-3-phosphate 1-O-acyltransferase PlsY [bacterium]